MSETKLVKSKKFKMVIITTCIIGVCHAVKVYFPEFPADYFSEKAIQLFSGWLTGHVAVDVTRAFKQID